MAHLVGMALFLAGLWLALSGDSTSGLLTLGVVSVAFIVFVARRMEVTDHESFPINLSIRGLTYFPWLLKEIIVSNIVVAKAIISGDIQPEAFTVGTTQDSELGQVVYANSITLTPGTITTDLEHGQLTVHSLLSETADGVRGGDMDQRVSRMTNMRKPSGGSST